MTACLFCYFHVTVLCFLLQAAELAEYSAKITALEEAKRAKEEEAETWHTKVGLQYAIKSSTSHRKYQKNVTAQYQI